MPAKIHCPVSCEELARLYELMPSNELAKYVFEQFGVKVSKYTVLAWLKKCNIPRRKYSPFEANKTECPYTRDRLHEMYWKDGLPCADIAEKAESILCRPVSEAIVQRWLREANIKLRTPREWLRICVEREPEKWKACAKHAQSCNPRVGTRTITPEMHKKGIEAAAAKKKAERVWETRQCALCGKDVTRPKTLFRNPPERTFCGRSCANRFRFR